MNIVSNILNKMPAKWILKIKNIKHHDQVSFSQELQDEPNVTYHTNGLSDRNHRIISTDLEKEIHRIYNPFTIKF